MESYTSILFYLVIYYILQDVPIKVFSVHVVSDSLLQSSDMALFDSLGDEDPGGESFEKLFERFARMKGMG